MKILFLHRNFPGQFKNLIAELVKDAKNEIYFITSNKTTTIEGVNKIIYEYPDNNSLDEENYLYYAEDAINHAKATAKAAKTLKDSGFTPDIIYGHSWGNPTFIKDVYQEVPLLIYFEWFYNNKNSDFDFGRDEISFEEKAKLRCKNFYLLSDLTNCDAGITPTKWQKKQFPKEFQNKIDVIYDGIDTEKCKPNPNTIFEIPNTNIKLSSTDKVITYATRGMEDYRGFPQFMIAAKAILEKHHDVHIVIAGDNEVFYGRKLTDTTYKDLMLSNLNLQSKNLHFVGTLNFENYIKLLQISSVHVYLTYPFVLSWSLPEAMACGCNIVASKTAPVEEVIKDNFNGHLCDFFNINELIYKIDYALEHKDEVQYLRNNARKKIIDDYSNKKSIPLQINNIQKIIHDYKLNYKEKDLTFINKK